MTKLNRKALKIYPIQTISNNINYSKMSFSNLPREVISHILDFVGYSDHTRFAMTCREYYELYRFPLELYVLSSRRPRAFIIKKLLELNIPRERIIVPSGCQCNIVMAWLHAYEEVLLDIPLVWWIRTQKIQGARLI